MPVLTPDEMYIKKFSYYNPQVPINLKATPIGYAQYLRRLIQDMHARGGQSYVDPDKMPPIPSEGEVAPVPAVPSNPTPVPIIDTVARESIAATLEDTSKTLLRLAEAVRGLK